MTAPKPPPTGPEATWTAALTTEHGIIYGYGMVAAYSAPELNRLVSTALYQHRRRRDEVIAELTRRSVPAPVAAAGYRLPMPLSNSTDACQLAVRMENDAAAAWRAVVEQAVDPADREFAVSALVQSAVLATRWNRVLGTRPPSQAFPGGTE